MATFDKAFDEIATIFEEAYARLVVRLYLPICEGEGHDLVSGL